MGYKAVAFDLDGTILDTVEDLRGALNHALAETGHRCDFTAAEVKLFFGSGALAAFARALSLEAGDPPDSLEAVGAPGDGRLDALCPEAERALAVFKTWYPAHCEIATRPYPGVPELMAALQGGGVKIAVVSNKLDAAAGMLCAKHFPGLVDAALGEREPEVRRKPAPDMLDEALRRLGVSRSDAVCVGDSEIDLETAENAGMDCIAVSWGFRSRAFLAARGAARIADDVGTLRRMILEH